MDALNVKRFAAHHGSGFALLNEPGAKIGTQCKSVLAKVPCEVKLPLLIELPAIGSRCQKVARAVRLPIINGVTRNGNVDGNQPRYVGKSTVSDSEERQFMVIELELAIAIQFVLLPVLQAVKRSVAVGGFQA